MSDETVCREGEVPEALFYLVDGLATVLQDGHKVIELEKHNFLAEMSFLTQEAASADVRVNGKALVWDRETLNDLEQVKPHLIHALRASIGKDLSQKLQRT